MDSNELISISQPRLPDGTEGLVIDVLRSGRLAQGPMVERFEALVGAITGVEHVVAVTSGTTALVAALEALELAPDDEVITSPFTFAATLNAILEAGATAVFADIGPDFNLDPDTASRAVTPRTRAILPVSLYGLPADMTRFESLANDRGLRLIEDAAQSIGSSIDERASGSFDIGTFSFYATKNVTTGEGGAVTTSDESVARRISTLRNQGMRSRYDYVVPGHNYRMTELQAAVGIPQLEDLGAVTASRQKNARRLTSGLSDLEGLVTPSIPPGRTHVFNQFTIRVTSGSPITRDQLAEHLSRQGIASGIYYPSLVFDYECYRSHPRVRMSSVPIAGAVSNEVLSLPVHPRLSDDQLDRIIASVRSAFSA